jgi:acyl-CoA synthetase (AMP-forming)/AMP-acid ligase II
MTNPNTLLEILQAAPGDQVAVILPEAGVQLTYNNLREQVMAMADALAAAGIRKGDRVATVMPNGLPAIVSFLAASIAGTAAPLNPGYREDEFRFYLEDTAAKVLLCPPEGAAEARRAAEGRVPVHAVEIDASGYVRMAKTGNGSRAGSPDPGDIALVLHTSGSTGWPKRVPILHSNLAASAVNIVATYNLGAQDVSLCVMPLFHVHGLVASTLSTILSGGTIVVPDKFNPLSFWRTVRDHRVTWYSAVPTIHQLLLARPEANVQRDRKDCGSYGRAAQRCRRR